MVPGPHWRSSGCSLDLQLDLMPLLDREWKGRIRKERGRKKREAMEKRGIGLKRVSWACRP